jgi:hypothetical protein
VILEDLTEEEKEEAVVQAALAKVAEFNKKQEALKDGYDCGIDEAAFDDMHKKLPKRNDPHNLLEQQTLYGNETGKFSNFLGGSKGLRDYFKRLQHPSEIPVKRAFDRIFKGVYSKKDLILSKNQPSSEQFNPLQTNPSESQTNSICNDAAQATTSTAPVIQSVNEDSDRTPSPPPEKSLTNKTISILDPTPDSEDRQPENNQEKPPTPNPDNDQHKPQTPPPENNQNNPPSPPPNSEHTMPTQILTNHLNQMRLSIQTLKPLIKIPLQ